ncbi:MAG: glycoside-pentoside-hexuronide (GPH):cation symporter [Succinatimonas sp.]|nr:glycoside-pentoside-hexuronide (GPH):cation symporter [Succinatimonas sp.]
MSEKISFREKFCYGLGDTSFNIFMGFTMMFLTIFYTDVFKLDPIVMGTLFLVTRIIDAISDPLCGMISDRTKSRFGRYRSWLLYFSIPYGISCAAVFFCPDLDGIYKTIYAYVTYIFLVLSFTCVCVPYVSLLGAISDDSDERLSINAIRFPLTKVAYIICSLIVPGLIALFDNEVIGYRVVMSGIGLLCIILVLLCFFNTKERVYSPVDDSLNFKKQIVLMVKNDQAMCMFLGQALTMIQNTLKYGAAAYFVKYVISSGAQSLSTILTAGSIAGIIAPILANYMLNKGYINRKNLLVFSQIIGGGLLLLIGLVASENIIVNSAFFFLSILSGELIAILVWASVADAGDYGYDKYGVRITGIISGGMLFSTKLGMAIGGAILGYVLAFYDYDPATATQASDEQLFAFVLLFSYLPAIFMFIAALAFSFYRLEANVCAKFKK